MAESAVLDNPNAASRCTRTGPRMSAALQCRAQRTSVEDPSRYVKGRGATHYPLATLFAYGDHCANGVLAIGRSLE